MESAGDEKRIRALFSEQRFADEQTAPGFNAVWLRAQSRAFKPRRAFNLSIALATALLVFVLASLAIWSRYSGAAAPASAFANVPAGAAFPARPIKNDESQFTGRENVAGRFDDVKRTRPRVRPGASSLSTEKRLALAATKAAEKEAKEIASWQSPTSSLLSSPSGDDLFKSIPQLNENANELKSFLPNRANDKEK